MIDIIECEKCGEEFPSNWQQCPFCDSGEKPDLRFHGED